MNSINWAMNIPERSDFAYVSAPDFHAIPTMTTPAEQRLYFLLASQHSGSGEVVEIGPWLGGSTLQIVSGLRQAGTGAILHVFDKFEWVSGANWDAKWDYKLNRGDCFRSYFEDNLGSLGAHVKSHKTSIQDMLWEEKGGVELLFLDAPKRVRDISKVLTTFARFIIPGITKMFWQDFIHFPSFEIAACLYRLSDYLEPLYISEPGTSMVFLVRKQWEDKDVSVDSLSLKNWTPEEIALAWEEWMALIGNQRSQFRFGSAMFLHDVDKIEHALERIRALYEHDPDGTEAAWKKFRKTHLLKRYQPLFDEIDRLGGCRA